MGGKKPSLQERRLWMGMARLVSHLSRQASRDVQDAAGINLSEMTLMGQIRQLGGAARMVDLADHLQLTKPAITKIVGSLESSGCVQRGDDPSDGRVSLVSLTPLGASTLRRAGEAFERTMRAGLWSRLNAEETEQIAALLDRVQGELGLADGAVMPPG